MSKNTLSPILNLACVPQFAMLILYAIAHEAIDSLPKRENHDLINSPHRSVTVQIAIIVSSHIRQAQCKSVAIFPHSFSIEIL